MVFLAVVGFERLVLSTVLEFGADSKHCGGIETSKGESPGDHCYVVDKENRQGRYDCWVRCKLKAETP